MKKIIIFIVLLIGIITIFMLNVNKIPPITKPHLDKSDCNEFGICKEGLSAVINGETFIINKETCLKHHKQWREDLNACYMR